MKRIAYLLLIALLPCVPCLAEDDDEEFDDLSLMLDLDGMETPAVQKLADKVLKGSDEFSTETAIRVIAHPKLNDARRAERLYRAFKAQVEEEHFEVLSDSPLLSEAVGDPVVSAILIRMAGLTKHSDARRILLERLRWGDPSCRAAAAHAIGLYGDRKLLPLLQREYRGLRQKASKDASREYGDGLVRGLLHLGDVKHLPRLLSEAADASKAVARTVLTIASGYTPPDKKHLARKRLPGIRQRHRALEYDIVEIAPLFPKELAKLITEATHPDVCDVLYRRLPDILTKESYPTFIPTLRAKCWDLRQLVLDLLLEGLAQPKDMPAIRKAVLEWYEGGKPIGRTWAVRNCRALDDTTRRQILMDALNRGGRWERVEAVREIRRAPDPDLLAAAKALAKSEQDPDVQFDLARLLLASRSAD